MSKIEFVKKLARVAEKRGYTPEEYRRRIERLSSGRRVCAHPKRKELI
jgi:hypothetical protein